MLVARAGFVTSLLFVFASSAAANDLSVSAPATVAPTPTETSTTAPVDTPFGLYPLWEHTAGLLPSGSYHVGYARAAVGIGPVQLGTQPLLDVYGTWNLELKLRLWRTERTRGALILGGYRVPTRAEARTLGNLDAPGFTNPYEPVWIVPVTFAKSFAASSRVGLHWASTLLLVTGERGSPTRASFGQTLLLEARASAESPWTARLHGGLEGVGVDPQAHAGLSLGYVGRVVSLSGGVARRYSFAGEPSTVLMFDGGLRFR